MTRRGIAGQCGAHRAAPLVAKNNDQPRTEMFNRVFDAPKNVIIDQVASVPDYKKIADVLIENDFRSSPRIGAAEDNSEWMLRLRRLRTAGGRRLACRNFAANKTRISFLKFRQCGIRAHRSDWMICGKNNRNDAKQTNERDQFGCSLHLDCDYCAVKPLNASKI